MCDPDKAINELYEENEALQQRFSDLQDEHLQLHQDYNTLKRTAYKVVSWMEESGPGVDELIALLTAKEPECEHLNAVSAVNKIIQSGMYCPDCNTVFAEEQGT